MEKGGDGQPWWTGKSNCQPYEKNEWPTMLNEREGGQPCCRGCKIVLENLKYTSCRQPLGKTITCQHWKQIKTNSTLSLYLKSITANKSRFSSWTRTNITCCILHIHKLINALNSYYNKIINLLCIYKTAAYITLILQVFNVCNKQIRNTTPEYTFGIVYNNR